jgi:hypothetical protein
MSRARTLRASAFRALMARWAQGACACLLAAAMLAGTAWGQGHGHGHGQGEVRVNVVPEIDPGGLAGGLTLLTGGLLLLWDRARKK